MRSGMESWDCEFIRAKARPDSLKGMPVKSPGLGPAPRSRASSWFFDCQEPDKSISASAGSATQINATPRRNALRVIFDSLSLPPRRTRGRFPAIVARLLLEMRGDDERLAQILGVGSDDRDHQHQIAIGLAEFVIIFGELRFVAVGNAILAKIAGLQVRGDHFERAFSLRRRIGIGRRTTAAAACDFPFRDGVPLQSRRTSGRFPIAEMEQPGLRAGVGIEPERAFVLPG